MPIAVDSVNNGPAGGTVSSLTWAHTCSGKDRYLLMFFRGGGGEGNKVTGVTYNGVPMTLVGVANYGEAMVVYGMVNPPAGTYNIVVSMSSSGFAKAGSISYTGVHQTNPLNGNLVQTAPTSVSQVTCTVTTTVPNCWLIVGAKNGSLTISAGTNCTLRVDCSSEGARSGDTNGPMPTGANNIQVTASGSSNWSVVGFALRPLDVLPGSPLFFRGGYIGG